MADPPNEAQITSPQARSLLERALGAIAAACLFAMMALTFATVVARYFLDRPIAGDSELQAFLLGLIIFSALPLVTQAQRHIAVRAVATLLKGPALRFQQSFVAGITVAGFAFIAFLIFLQGKTLGEEDIRTSYLNLPEAPFAYFFAALVLVAAVAAAGVLITLLRARNDTPVVPRPEAGVE